MILEIACFSLEAAVIAGEAGADRIELCSGPLEGGLTPSYSMISLARNALKLPVHVMVRPREGDFLYSPREFKSMEYDIRMIRDAGIEGVVLGILNPDASVDIRNLSQLVKIAEPMNVTFHRAFDLTADPVKSLSDIVDAGVSRILTSGQRQTAVEGKELIAKLVQLSKRKISIMPGSDVNALNIFELCRFTQANEIHASARIIVKGRMTYSNASVNLHAGSALNDTSVLMPDAEQIRKMKKEITKFMTE